MEGRGERRNGAVMCATGADFVNAKSGVAGCEGPRAE